MNKAEKERREKLQKLFGVHLKKIRTKKGFTGVELADLCDMEKQHINRIEKGNVNTSLYILKKISAALNIKLKELFDGFDY